MPKIDQTLAVLKQGGLVIFPSDTVYGLLADATNEEAVKKLIEFKSRPSGKPISVFCNFQMLDKLVKINQETRNKLQALLPGPFTVVLRSKHIVSKLLESEKRTLGIRIPDYKLINELVSKFNKPITATSANIAGRSPHYSIESLMRQLSQKKKDLIDLVVDAGKLPRNKPSTVVDLTEPQIKIIRKGDVVFKDSRTFVSNSEAETKKIAKYLLNNQETRYKKQTKPLIFIIEGELGVGKTIFVKGIGEYLGVRDIISPSFVIYYEYEIKITKKQDTRNKLIHVDLYNLQEEGEFEHLGLERYLKPGNILCFEWGEKGRAILKLLKKKARIVYVKMRYISENKRELKIQS